MTVRKYGRPTFRVAVLHGGPGAPGYMAPVARELGRSRGVLEPLQSADSLVGQIEELARQLETNGDLPITLIGSSWGAVLALFLAADKSEMVEKLILVGCAVFDAASSASIEQRRLDRLDQKTRQRYEDVVVRLEQAPPEKRKQIAEEWGDIFLKTDIYDPLTTDLEVIEVQYDLFKKVWSDFVELRDRPGFLKNRFSSINRPVAVIHGAEDPHPLEGIQPFLEDCLPEVRFHILPKCGHYPWIERHAAGRFYEILREEI